ncbi:serine/threonine protein kinase [Roseimicrobium gellanilyticum]|uniref:Serine/threonine protein kinase n=1 Tax=Roseimicrobium gellanilyticum TaxID=748857 RepID=A0A366HII5_9BACT|nr:serine/threonine-protein kinase [Roseimicrobium gellanilyticum]RBP42577.1 serine/threonine protein kinase [Roseimicrobium gellanilyticum]
MTTEQVATPPSSDTSHAPDAYSVKERVSIGTAGVVYRAVQRSSHREVLFKVLMEQASHPLNSAQVLAVAPAIMRLRHPRIAELMDAYDDPEGTVLVYPMMPGMAGSEFPIKERLLTPAEARQVAKQLCEALLVGERAAFPHGDVKPSNIVIGTDTDGRLSVQLQDWGLSSCRTLQPPETMQFMAPERHHGHPTSVQGDLFSLGASLWFLITGRLPVESHTREELLVEWGAFDPSTLAGLQPEVDKHFSQWLGWLLRWQPRDRPPTMTKALEVLNQVIAFVDASETKASSGSGSSAAAPAPPAPTSTSTANPNAPTLPAKPIATRPSAARTEKLRQTPGDSGPPSAASPSAPTALLTRPSGADSVSAQERGSMASKLMAGVLTCCVLAAVGVLFVWWAEEEWGPDWRKEMVASLKSRLRTASPKESDLAAAAAPSESADQANTKSSTTATKSPSKSSGAAVAVTANASAQKPPPKSLSAKSGSKPTKPQTPPPNNSKLISAVEPFNYADGMTLEGANGGTGWKTPWKASQATKGKSADGKYQGVLLASTPDSSISRELDPGGTFHNNSVAVSLDLWHPGAGASPLEFDLLGTANAPSGSAIIVTPHENRLKISIKGETEELPANAGVPLKLVLKWTFTKKADSTADVVVEVYVNPKQGTSVTNSPKTKKNLTSYKLPTTLTFTAKTTEAGSAPVVLQKMKLARTAADAIK